MKMKDTNEKQPEETDQQSYTDSQPETETDATTAKLPEYFSMKLLPLIHEVYAGGKLSDATENLFRRA